MRPPIHKRTFSASHLTVPGRVIHVADQRGVPTLWYEADGLNRRYVVVVTGECPPDGSVHVGSFLTHSDNFVGHLYGEPE